jgi:hypothetical protein
MTDKELIFLLADYAAPTEDQGFSEAMLATLKAEEDAVLFDLDSLVKKPMPIWRSWLIAGLIALLCGLIWTRLGVSMPDIEFETSLFSALNTGWAAYGLAGLCLAACLLLVETEAF